MVNDPADEFAGQRTLKRSPISVAERAGGGWMRFCALAVSSPADFVGPSLRIGSRGV